MEEEEEVEFCVGTEFSAMATTAYILVAAAAVSAVSGGGKRVGSSGFGVRRASNWFLQLCPSESTQVTFSCIFLFPELLKLDEYVKWRK